MELHESGVVVLHDFGNKYAIWKISTDVFFLSGEGKSVNPIKDLLILVLSDGGRLHIR
jgi:hypothetical protein